MSAMSEQRANAHWVVWLTLLMAYILSILPLPVWLSVARPAWIPMVILYWIMALPERFGLMFAFIAGILLDVFLGTYFGQSAIGLLVIAVAVSGLHRRLRMFPWWQQAFMVFIIIGLYQVVNLWLRALISGTAPSLWYLLPSVTSAVLWPWVSGLLRFLRRYYRVV